MQNFKILVYLITAASLAPLAHAFHSDQLPGLPDKFLWWWMVFVGVGQPITLLLQTEVELELGYGSGKQHNQNQWL